MTDPILETGSAIADYIRDVKNQIKKGLGEDASLAGPIDLEISTTLEKSAGGGFFISVLQADAKIKHEQVHKMKIPIKLNSEADKIEGEARIKEAEYSRELAERKVNSIKKGPWIA